MLAYSLLPTPLQTPLVRQGAVWLKMEGYQHTGSVKYRMVYERVVAACIAGELTSASVLNDCTGFSGLENDEACV